MHISNIMINESTPGVLTLPSASSPTKFPMVLLFHGFSSDKNEVANIYADLAESLAKINIATIRIDFPGCGDSSMHLQHVTLSNMEQSIRDTYLYAQSLPNVAKIGVCGFSFGAALTMLSFADDPTYCSSAVLLSPVGNLTNDFSEFLGSQRFLQAASQPLTEIDLGWKKIKISNNYFKRFNEVDPYQGAIKYKNPLLIIAGSLDFSAKNARMYNSSSLSANKQLVIYEGHDHILNLFDPDKKSSLIDKIVSWFLQTLN